MAIEVTSVHERRPPLIKGSGQAIRYRAQQANSRALRIILYVSAVAIVITVGAAIAFLVSSYNSYSKIVDARLASGYLTSRAGIYAAPRTLHAGQSITHDGLIALLRRAGYLETDASNVWSGSFAAEASAIEIRPRRLNASNAPSVVRVNFDKNGRVAELRSDTDPLDSFTLEPEILTTDASMKAGKRAALAFQDIPHVLVRAILSIEDHRFFEHAGLDLWGVGRALLRNAGEERIGQGGSTITQQLVKNTYLTPERTLRRKFAEAMLAYTLERRLSKQDIFALYANEVYLGQRGAIGVRGVEQAAHSFFGKDLKSLSLAEAATLAGMIQSPSRYAPDRHAEAATARRNMVIAAMLRDGAITNEQAAAASGEPLTVARKSGAEESLAPYFVDYVNRVVESRLESSKGTDERAPRIYTTIDLDLQQLAEAALKRQLERLDKIYKGRGATPQAALVALDPQTGNVLAMIGGRNYAESQLNRATDALRQPGSVFKPVVYAAALESGISPVEMFTDAPREFQYDRRAVYRPANYGGAYSMHDVMMRTGLVKSLNVVTVDLAMRTGLPRVARMAQSFGLPKPEPYPALALGTTEATPLQVAAAYTAFVRNGQRVEPHVIARATDASGAELINALPQTHEVIKPTTAYMMTDMLSGVIDHGTARAARGAVKRTAIAGKTGSSHDGWFVGYTPNLVCAVWIGFDDNKQLGLTGAEAALPAWTEFIKGAVELRPELGGEAFERPAGITTVEIDSETGMLATPSCPQRERIAITTALAPNMECHKHGQAFELTASLDQTELNSPSTITQSDSAVLITRDSTTTRRSSLPRAITNGDTIEPPPMRTTHVVNVHGRSTLVNELRLNTSRTSPAGNTGPR